VDIVRVVDYLKKILKTRQDQVNQVITSDVKNFEEYKYLLGKLHAYKETIQELTDLLKKQEQYEDEIEDNNPRK
jgi:K+/H+ antiporter YhaU regulatory subunit KhtT